MSCCLPWLRKTESAPSEVAQSMHKYAKKAPEGEVKEPQPFANPVTEAPAKEVEPMEVKVEDVETAAVETAGDVEVESSMNAETQKQIETEMATELESLGIDENTVAAVAGDDTTTELEAEDGTDISTGTGEHSEAPKPLSTVTNTLDDAKVQTHTAAAAITGKADAIKESVQKAGNMIADKTGNTKAQEAVAAAAATLGAAGGGVAVSDATAEQDDVAKGQTPDTADAIDTAEALKTEVAKASDVINEQIDAAKEHVDKASGVISDKVDTAKEHVEKVSDVISDTVGTAKAKVEQPIATAEEMPKDESEEAGTDEEPHQATSSLCSSGR